MFQTDLEHTNYYFDVQADSLEGALDRFAQCFIGPLFTQSALEREVQAVDSEHAKNLQSELWRSYQLSKSSIIRDLDEDNGSDKTLAHPFASFGSGNKESLPITGKDGSKDIRSQLMEWYQQHYQQSLGMYKLCVLGKESLDELQAMVERYFTELAGTIAHHVPREELLPKLFPTILESLNVPQRLNVVPTSEGHSVEYQFPLRELKSLYKSKPTRYLSHLVGHEGKGSLLSLLKAKHLAQELYADDSSKSCIDWAIFTIKIDLTQQGLEQVDEVTKIVFAYIQLLKTDEPQEWVQQELQTVANLQFRFLSQRNPMDYTCSLAGWMQDYPPEHYLSGPYKVYDWNPDAVKECLHKLTPNNVFMMVASKSFEGSTTQQEKWYGTQYEPVELKDSLLQEWDNVAPSEYPDLKLPEKNEMIATDFEIKDGSNVPKDRPVCIIDEELCRLFYKPDNVFDMPKVNIMFELVTREAYQTPESLVCTHLWTEILEEQLNEFTYLASMAGLHCDVSYSKPGIQIHVSGYSHKANVLLERIVHAMQHFEVDQELFDRIHDKISKKYSRFRVAQPYQHAVNGCDQCLEGILWTNADKVSALAAIQMADVANFGSRLFKRFKLEGLVHGNVSAEQAKELAQIVLSMKPLTEEYPLEHRVVELKDGMTYNYRFKELNEENTNSVLATAFQVGPLELVDNATLAFLQHLIREPAFNQLRTEEQLGYIVHTSVKTSGVNVKGLLFLIQSDSFDPLHLDERVEVFLASFRERIINMTDEVFQQNIDAVVTNFLEKNKNLGEESSRYWQVIAGSRSYHFSRLQEIAEHVKTMSKFQVLRFFDRYISKTAPSRRKICIQVFSKQHEESMAMNVKEDENNVVIQSPVEFKRVMPFFPLPEAAKVEVSQ